MGKGHPVRNEVIDARFAYLGDHHLGGIERCIAAGAYVDGSELASSLRNHGTRPIPTAVMDYLCRFLEGFFSKPRGRKGWQGWPRAERLKLDMIVTGSYRRNLKRLTDRRDRYGHPAGWTRLEGTPGEIAARIVAKQFLFGEESWRSVQNIASSRK